MPKHSTLKSDVRVLHYSQNTHTLTDCPPPPTPPPPLCSPLPCRARFPSLPLPSPVTAANSKQPTASSNSNSNSDNRTAAAPRSTKVRSVVRSGQVSQARSQRQSGRQPKEGAKHGHTKKSVTKASKGTKRARRNPKRTWNVYVSRSLRSINSQMSMTSRTMKIVNSFVSDLFERIATEAATIVRVNRKRTLGARELQTAVRLVLPADLAKHAMAEGTKAVSHASS
ncbi:putative Core histone H2A H2B H3 H4 [Trypanosoma vivax]|nr:putative Core histone H2A H2B H3 H4 [Trypanosoma vivax]